MNNKITKPIAAGLIATVVMTIVMFMAPLMGLPKMNTAEMLSMMLGVPVLIGWFMHFMIGTIFAFAYSLIFARVLGKISGKFVRGAIYGFIVFLFAQMVMTMMGLIIHTPPANGNVALILLGGLLGHLVYGVAVTEIIKEKSGKTVEQLANS